MLRFVIGALLLSTTVLGAVQPNRDARQYQPQQGVPYQGENVQARQGFGPAWSSQLSVQYIQGFGLTGLLIFGLLSVLDLIFSQVKLSDALGFAIGKDLPLRQNENTLYRSIDYYTNLSNQKFLGNVDLTTPFGGAGVNANVGLPAPANNLLTTAVIGLGVLSLINTVATVVTPYFSKNDETVVDTGNKTATSRSMRNLFQQTTIDTLENAVVETLLKAKDKYL